MLGKNEFTAGISSVGFSGEVCFIKLVVQTLMSMLPDRSHNIIIFSLFTAYIYLNIIYEKHKSIII